VWDGHCSRAPWRKAPIRATPVRKQVISSYSLLESVRATSSHRLAFPIDPQSKIVRDGSRLNQVLLIRLDAEAFVEDTKARSALGIVAYSAICTHAGCEVSDWLAQTQMLMCFCHYSQFDPKDGARVVDGPAPRRLAALPLKVVDGVLMAAGGFSGRVGFQQG
jgi:rieske iron-sulfur protein